MNVEYRGHKVTVNLFSGSIKYEVTLDGQRFVFANKKKLENWIDAYETERELGSRQVGPLQRRRA
jgi:hypothetical protein